MNHEMRAWAQVPLKPFFGAPNDTALLEARPSPTSCIVSFPHLALFSRKSHP